MAMVSNKFLAALSAKLGFHKHVRVGGSLVEYQNREYAVEIREAETESDGSRDYWMATKTPPKVYSVSDSHYSPTNKVHPVSLRRARSLPGRHFRRLRVQL